MEPRTDLIGKTVRISVVSPETGDVLIQTGGKLVSDEGSSFGVRTVTFENENGEEQWVQPGDNEVQFTALDEPSAT